MSRSTNTRRGINRKNQIRKKTMRSKKQNFPIAFVDLQPIPVHVRNIPLIGRKAKSWRRARKKKANGRSLNKRPIQQAGKKA